MKKHTLQASTSIVLVFLISACLGTKPSRQNTPTPPVVKNTPVMQTDIPLATSTPASLVSLSEKNPLTILPALRPGIKLCTGLTTNFHGRSPQSILFAIGLSPQSSLELDIIRQDSQGWVVVSTQPLGQGASCQNQRLEQYDLNGDGIFEVAATGVWDVGNISSRTVVQSHTTDTTHEEWLAVYGWVDQKLVSLFNTSSATAIDPTASPENTSTYWDFESNQNGFVNIRAMSGYRLGTRGSTWPYACFTWHVNSLQFEEPVGGVCPGSQAAPTPTPTPTPEPTLILTAHPCSGAPGSHLVVGMTAQVSKNPPISNNVRKNPDTGAVIVGTIGPGTVVSILDGPSCGGSFVWWKISAPDGTTGWTAEGDATSDWLMPYSP